MKKILHIQVLPILSGAQRISFEILKSLSNTEYDKTILFSSQGTDEQKQEIENYFKTIHVRVVFSSYLIREISLRNDWYAFFEIYTFCKKEQFDIVHTHSTKPGIIGRIAATFAGVPLVVHTVHGVAFHPFIPFPKRQFYWLCETVASFFCDRIVLVNNYYKRYFRIFKNKVIRIYNAIDYSQFSLMESNPVNDEKIRVLFVGRLDTQKNPLLLLKAAKIVIEKCNNVIFTIVGNGELYEDCVKYLQENNLEDSIKLVGWDSNPAKFYCQADIFAAASIYEAFGLMFLEAGYFGLPVCATNVEGIPEVIEHNVTGLLCNPNDEQTMADNILKLCENKNLRLQMGYAAKKRVENIFALNLMTQKYQDIY